MEALEFTKGHGTGNDFVILSDPEGTLVLSPKLVTALCDRRYGIGADGVLRVVRTAAVAGRIGSDVGRPEPDLASAAEWFMDYRNADGSVAETCGNGLRVFARYLAESGLVATGGVSIATRAGVASAVITEEAVSVTMGLPTVLGEEVARVAGRNLVGRAVDCGNPHLVCPVPADLSLPDLDLSEPPVVDQGRFPAGVNVEFTSRPPGEPEPGSGAVEHLRMRVHERGVGETPSCGSGACAAAAAALHAAGRTSGVVTVDVPGGRLAVSLTTEDCVLTGPAVLVASGTVSLTALGVIPADLAGVEVAEAP